MKRQTIGIILMLPLALMCLAMIGIVAITLVDYHNIILILIIAAAVYGYNLFFEEQ